jgi:catechol 2,3-dioxygenase-like lactoylglutathione lyase family enzyme
MSTASPSTASTLTSQTGARFHLSLNVADLPQSIAFFQAFFGCDAAKCRDDYAKFELTDPPLVLSLEPYRAPPGGNLNHLGFRVESSAALVEVQRRLELAGISTRMLLCTPDEVLGA